MEPILFYGVPQGCSFGSIVALEWLNQPYRLCRINMPEEVHTDLYGRVNPIRETPSMMLEDGRTLSQSAAILQHIAARGAQQGLGFPAGSADYDRLIEILGFLNTTFFSAFGPLWLAYDQAEDPSVQRVLRETGKAQVTKAHAQLARLLGEREWLLGSQRTVVDAYFIGISRWTSYHKVLDQREYPNLYWLIQKLEADPAVKFAHAIEDEQPAHSAGGLRGHVSLKDLKLTLAA
jgi:glutathione S-transferase